MIAGTGMVKTLAFYFLAGVTLASAVGVVTRRNLVHSAFLLALTFLGVAGLYMLLEAEFLAAVQALVLSQGALPPATLIAIAAVELASYDALLSSMEVAL